MVIVVVVVVVVGGSDACGSDDCGASSENIICKTDCLQLWEVICGSVDFSHYW